MTPEQVKLIRETLGLSQAELARRIVEIDPALKTSTVTVSRWETGNRTPDEHAQRALHVIARTFPPAMTQHPPVTLADITCPECATVGMWREYGTIRYGRDIRWPDDDPSQPATRSDDVPGVRQFRQIEHIECYMCGYRLSEDTAARFWGAIDWMPFDELDGAGLPASGDTVHGHRSGIMTTAVSASSYGQPVFHADGMSYGSAEVGVLTVPHATDVQRQRMTGAGYQLSGRPRTKGTGTP